MEVTLNRKALKEAITALKPCLPIKPLSEYESNMMLVVTPASVELVATDMVQEGVMPVSFTVAANTSCDLVPDIKKLERVLTKSDTEDVALNYDEGSGALRISSGTGFVDVPTLSARKMGRYDAPVSAGSSVGSVPASVLAAGLSFVSCVLPEMVTGNLKYEVAILSGGLLSGANGWNRRGYFVSPSLKLDQEVKFLQRYVETLPKLLRHVKGNVEVTLYERSMTFVEEGKFRYTCTRARHETPDVVMKYLKSEDPYVVVDPGKMVKVLDKVVIPDYQAAGSAVGVKFLLSPAAPNTKSATLDLKLVSAGGLQAEDSIKCTREAEPDGTFGIPMERVIDYRMFKAMANEVPASGDTKLYICNPASRFFKFQCKYLVGEYTCVSVSVGSYSKVVGHD